MTAGALLVTRPATDDEPTRLDLLSDAGLVEEFLEVRHRVACLEARSAALLGAIEQRGIPAVEGFGSPTGWLMALNGDPAAVCRQVARHMPELPGHDGRIKRDRAIRPATSPNCPAPDV